MSVQEQAVHGVSIREALGAGWFELWYQPKIDLRTMSVAGAEALIRMRHPRLGMLGPAAFLPRATGEVRTALSICVIDRAIRDWHYFFAKHGPIEIAINLSTADLSDPRLLSKLCRTLPKHASFERFIIEIDADDLLGNLDRAQELVRQLQSKKMRIAVDDLGDEWQALLRLRNFPLAEVKADQRFVSGCADDPTKRAVCRGIIELAAVFGCRSVAEGVESLRDFITVRELGFTHGQGFLFSRPCEASNFARLMSQNCFPLSSSTSDAEKMTPAALLQK